MVVAAFAATQSMFADESIDGGKVRVVDALWVHCFDRPNFSPFGVSILFKVLYSDSGREFAGKINVLSTKK